MAPVGENVDVNGFSTKKKEETDNKENLWSAILGEVQTRGNTKLPSCKSVVVLGDNESGKTTLIAKLQGVEDPKKGSGLEYAYIDVRDEYRDDVKKWQDYVEPGDELEQGSPMRRTSRNLDEEGEILPLGEGVLTRNLGLDVVVVVTKTDYMTTLEKDFDYRDEHFDFMQQWIRRFCLQYGAALFYTSAKEDKNCDLLYKYLTHRIYGFPFRTPALVVEKDAVLIPSGWDNMKKISILYENMQSMKPEDYYRDVIVPPVVRKPVTRESETQAEDEQSFLTRQLQLLQQGAPNMRQESPLRTPAGVPKAGDHPRRSSGAPGVQGQLSPAKKDININSGADLTNDRPHTTVDKAVMRSDAAAELDRLTRNKKPSAPPDQNSSDC
ncbi:Cytoplasmic dynein 1 light intermediate chain 2 [Blattella germanica]|nr:Cytoplasmic dynein 1 light intermediate chain 2 [Blattella germanica]